MKYKTFGPLRDGPLSWRNLAYDLANWKTKSLALWFNFSLNKQLYDIKTKKNYTTDENT